jgi:hypothetical protein
MTPEDLYSQNVEVEFDNERLEGSSTVDSWKTSTRLVDLKHCKSIVYKRWHIEVNDFAVCPHAGDSLNRTRRGPVAFPNASRPGRCGLPKTPVTRSGERASL